MKFFDNSIGKIGISAVFFIVLFIFPIILRGSGYGNESYVEGVLILCMMWAP